MELENTFCCGFPSDESMLLLFRWGNETEEIDLKIKHKVPIEKEEEEKKKEIRKREKRKTESTDLRIFLTENKTGFELGRRGRRERMFWLRDKYIISYYRLSITHNPSTCCFKDMQKINVCWQNQVQKTHAADVTDLIKRKWEMWCRYWDALQTVAENAWHVSLSK